MKNKKNCLWISALIIVCITAALFIHVNTGEGKNVQIPASENVINDVDESKPHSIPVEIPVPSVIDNITEDNISNDTQDTEVKDPNDETETGEKYELPWCLILVNRSNPLPDDYLIEVTHLSNGQDVDNRIYPALQQMFDDMRAQNIYPVVASGYRTYEKQQEIMSNRISEYTASGMTEEEAKNEAEKWVALPGTSEHQLGICVDINADGIHSAGYEVYAWLDEHAHEYGFIKRYPEDKTDITGISNEPWHYRYVGIEYASKIKELNMCLEEYVEYIKMTCE